MLAADYVDPVGGPGRFDAPPSSPSTDPAALARAEHERSTSVLPVIVAVSSAVLLGAVGVVIGILVSQRSGPEGSPSATIAYPAQTTSSASRPTTDETQSLPSAPASSTADPEAAALQRLQQIANSDRPFVTAVLADHWVPQLSSKRPGVVDEGVVWNNAMTLQEHLDLREQYPGVRLLWSGDWSTFSGSNYWVTVVGITYPDSSGALAWCTNQSLDNDHCIAKFISATSPVDGSTAYN